MTISKKSIATFAACDITNAIDQINRTFEYANVEYPKEIIVDGECFSMYELLSKFTGIDLKKVSK